MAFSFRFFLRNFNLCHIHGSTRVTADLPHLVENAIRRKRSHAPTLTLAQTKYGLKVSYGTIILRNNSQNNADEIEEVHSRIRQV